MSHLFSMKNVIGVGQGYKTIMGQKTDLLSLVVMVEKKIPLKELNAKDVVPIFVDGYMTDVIEVGKIKALSTTGRYRPAPGGVSIGHKDITAGTLGCVVEDTTDGHKVILSNNHVLANSNMAEIGDEVLQPGPYDGGSVSQDTIANLKRYQTIYFDGEVSECPVATGMAKVLNGLANLFKSDTYLQPLTQQETLNYIDAAIAEPINPDDVLEEILTIGEVNGHATGWVGMDVQKYGRTTDYNTDEILIQDAIIQVSYGDGKMAIFDKQLVAGPMSAGGDSGSLVLNMDSEAVGLLFAGSDTHTILNPIEYVISALKIRF